MREKRVSCFNDTRICPETRFKEMRNSTFDTLVGDAISKLRGDFILRVSKNIKPQNSYFTLSKRNGLISRIIFNFLGIILGRDAATIFVKKPAVPVTQFFLVADPHKIWAMKTHPSKFLTATAPTTAGAWLCRSQ